MISLSTPAVIVQMCLSIQRHTDQYLEVDTLSQMLQFGLLLVQTTSASEKPERIGFDHGIATTDTIASKRPVMLTFTCIEIPISEKTASM